MLGIGMLVFNHEWNTTDNTGWCNDFYTIQYNYDWEIERITKSIQILGSIWKDNPNLSWVSVKTFWYPIERYCEILIAYSREDINSFIPTEAIAPKPNPLSELITCITDPPKSHSPLESNSN